MNTFFDPWIWRMAWRDGRGQWRRLLLYISAIILGVAALVALRSFKESTEQAMFDQSKTLLGADAVLASNRPFSDDLALFLDTLSVDQSRVTTFASMVYFPKTGDTRLTEVRAMETGFPYYGTLDTDPPNAVFLDGPKALVEEWMALQFGAAVGDSVQVGSFQYEIAGLLKNLPGEIAIGGLVSPRVLIPQAYLEQTKLLQRGSLANYRVYFHVENEAALTALESATKPLRETSNFSFDTVEERRGDWGEAANDLYSFLNLVGFIALLLGGIGVASTIHVYIKQKISTIAVLRCLGGKGRQAFAIYLVQAVGIGLIGALLGVIAGTAVQVLLPQVLADFLPVDVDFSLSWSAVAQGLSVGLGVTLLFALLPLLPIRHVSPLLTLRMGVEAQSARRDPWRWAVLGLIGMGMTAFAIAQTGEWDVGLAFSAAIGLALGLLLSVAKGVTWAVRKFFPTGWAYVWRQGLANLYRPNNQTVVLLLALGLGTFLIATLYLSRDTLLDQVDFASSGDRPNMVLFDIQPDQQAGVADVVRSFDAPVLQQVPIVTMRLAAIKGRPVGELLRDTTQRISRFALRREYRSTYRDHLTDPEILQAGTWQGQVEDPNARVPISLETDIAERLRVDVGDSLTFDVQGVPVATVVGSIRLVDWERVQPNFFVVFPTGVLEAAPQFGVLVTRVPSVETSANIQRAVVQQYPNVSTIDLSLILQTVDNYLEKIAFVVQFMALFSIITGLVVLASAVIASRFQRIRESVLLRTLGASQRQVRAIMVVEYLFLGSLSALVGLLLALLGAWALAFFVFDAPYTPDLLPIVLLLTGIVALTLGIGLLNSRGIHNRPPLEVLRAV